MKLFNTILLLLFLLLPASSIFCQQSFICNVSGKTIARNETLQVTYEIKNGNLESFSQPSFADWEMVGGPMVSSGNYIINGQRSSSISYRFVLKPKRAGKLALPGAKAVIDGKSLNTNSFTITVENRDAAISSGSGQASSPLPFFDEAEEENAEEPTEDYDAFVLKAGESATEKTKANLFIKVDVSKKNCYIGEAIQASYKLYTRVNLNAQLSKRPSFAGFSSIDLPDSTNGEYYMANYNGKNYRVYTIRKVQLFPLLTGNQVLLPAEVEAVVQYKKMPTSDNLLDYDPFSSNNMVAINYTVKSNPVDITIMPLPVENKPADFTGAVGNFTIKAAFEKKELLRKETGKLRVEISGEGNWNMVQPPNITWPNGVDVYKPKISENIDSQSVPLKGNRVYEYTFTSNMPGNITIQPIGIDFFSVANKKYIRDTTNVLHFTVLDEIFSALPIAEMDEKIDATEIFSSAIKAIFPALAFLLLCWLLIRGNKKRVERRQEILWQKHFKKNNQLKSILHEQKRKEQEKEEINVAATTPSPPLDDSRYQPIFLQPQQKNENENIVAVKSPPAMAAIATEQNEISAKEFFISVKAELQEILQSKWKINDVNNNEIKQKLIEKGLLQEDVQAVTILLDACNKYIYSPSTVEVNLAEWKQIAIEIKQVLGG